MQYCFLRAVLDDNTVMGGYDQATKTIKEKNLHLITYLNEIKIMIKSNYY